MTGYGHIRSGLAVFLVLSSACVRPTATGSSTTGSTTPARIEAKSAERPTRTESPTGQAVIAVGSHLFFSSSGEAGFELPPLGDAPGMAVSVVGEQDGQLVIETLVAEPADHHCTMLLGGLDRFRLRFHVAKDALLPVLTDELEHIFADGTKVRLARGVPVPPGSTELLVLGTPIQVPVPQERLGLVYTPGAPFPIEGADGLLGARPVPEDLTYAGGRILNDVGLDFEGDSIVRYGTIVREDDALVTVRNPCIEVTARVPHRLLRPLPDPTVTPAQRENWLRHPEIVRNGFIEPAGLEHVRLVYRGRPTERHLVKAGTAVLWPDGRPAGQVSADQVLDQERRDEGELACFAVPLDRDEPTTLTLCFAAADALPFSPPRVHQGKATLAGGSHDGEIIRRIVRAHINEVRFCYDQGLTRDPALAGTVSVRFDLAPSGDVTQATVAESTLPDEAVAACIAKAVKRWTFPRSPGGDVTIVALPFTLEPG